MITAEQELVNLIGENWEEDIDYGVICYLDSSNSHKSTYRIPSIRPNSLIDDIRYNLSNIKDSVMIENLTGFIVLKNGNWLERINNYPNCGWKFHFIPSESEIYNY